MCVTSLTWEHEAQSAERAHTHLLLPCSCTHLTAPSGETAGQLSPAPVQGAAVSTAQQRHAQIHFSTLSFPALTPPSISRQPQSSTRSPRSTSDEASNFPQSSTNSLLIMRAEHEMKGLKDTSPFTSRSSHHPLRAGLMHFRVHQEHFEIPEV